MQAVLAARLLTLTGAGGVGKTRLAIELGRRLLPEFDDGVWFVDLSVVADPGLLVRAIIETFKLPVMGKRASLDTLLTYLQDRRLLLILDNCEHLIEISAQIVERLLEHCPGVTILVTSREKLHCAGETEWRVPSLTRPPLRLLNASAGDLAISPDELQKYEAARLFAARVQMLQPDFGFGPHNAAAIAHICSRLDGIPLALEMTAARVSSMTVQEISQQLAGVFDHRFALLTNGRRTAPPRHRTLRATLDWSYSLLKPSEQRLLAQMSVFSGGWTAEAAQFVVGEGAAAAGALEPQPSSAVFGHLAELVDKSLVIAEQRGGHTHYRMLETVRQFAAEKLNNLGETQAIGSRHFAYYFNLVRSSELILLAGPKLKAQLAVLDSELDNLRAALRWAQQTGDAESFAWLVAALWPYWRERGDHREGRKWLRTALESSNAIPAALQARLQVGLAVLLFHVDAPQMVVAAEQALALSRDADDPLNLAWAASTLGAALWRAQQYDEALGYLEQALELARAVDSPEAIRSTLMCLSSIMVDHGERRRGTIYCKECMSLAWKWQEPAFLVWSLRELAYLDLHGAMIGCERELARQRDGHDPEGLAQVLQCYGRLLLESGEYDRATRVLAESAALWRTLEFQWSAHGSLALTLFDLALAAWLKHDAALALGAFQESLALFNQVEDTAVSCHIHVQLGYYWLDQQDLDQAYRHFLEGAARLRASGWNTRTAVVVAGLAELLRRQGDAPAAARLFGAAELLGDNADLRSIRCERTGFDRVMAAARGQLVDPASRAAWAAGAELAQQDAVEWAVGRLEGRFRQAGEPPQGVQEDVGLRQPNRLREPRAKIVAGLTPREREILALVAQGLSDSQIAQRLVISPRTVNTHLSSIFRKLDVPSRMAAVRYALDNALL